MDSLIPYPSHVVGNENRHFVSSPNSFLAWLNTFEMQAAAKLVPVVPQFLMPDLQNQGIPHNMPSQPSQAWQQDFLMQENASLSYVAPQIDTQVLYPVHFAPVDVPPGPRPPFHDCTLTCTIQGEFNSLQFETPRLSQSQVAQPDCATVTDVQRQVCPLCMGVFFRKQERDRHIRSFLPHSVYCAFGDCSWRGDRLDNLRKHQRTKHPHFDFPVQPPYQIYNPDPLVELIVRNQLSIESAADFALLLVECRADELKKVGVWKDWWGRKPKKFDHPRPRV